jgi:hypothetical protein
MFYHLFIVFIVIIEFIMKMRENSMEEPKTVGFCWRSLISQLVSNPVLRVILKAKMRRHIRHHPNNYLQGHMMLTLATISKATFLFQDIMLMKKMVISWQTFLTIGGVQFF